jgi:hypothetical protein
LNVSAMVTCSGGIPAPPFCELTLPGTPARTGYALS